MMAVTVTMRIWCMGTCSFRLMRVGRHARRLAVPFEIRVLMVCRFFAPRQCYGKKQEQENNNGSEVANDSASTRDAHRF